MVINRGKRNKTLNEVQPIENRNNPQSFPKIRPVLKEVPPFHKLQDHLVAESILIKKR